MNTVKIPMSPEQLAGLEALGEMLRQLSPLEMAYFCGVIHGRTAKNAEPRDSKEDA